MVGELERILLIEPKSAGDHIYSNVMMPRLGLPQLGAILKGAGYEVKIIVEEMEPKKKISYGKIADFNPDLIGLSLNTSTAPGGYEIADDLKTLLGVPIAFGGAHTSFMPEEALMHGDYVLRKEADLSFPLLLESLKAGKTLESTPGLSFKNADGFVHVPDGDFIRNLDLLPDPDLTLIDNHERLKVIPISTSRGCPYDCKFCSVIKMFGRQYRFRSSERVVGEMKKYPGKLFFIVDDNFSANKKRSKELLNMVLENDINNEWSTQVRADIYKDEELLALMKKTHCNRVYIGFESINPQSLEGANKKQSLEDITKAITAVHKHGMSVHGMFVFGFETDTPQTIAETVRFAKNQGIDTVQFLILTPLPGTDTYNALDREGRIFCKNWKYYDAHHAVFEPKGMTSYQLQMGTFKAMNRFYSFWNSVTPLLSPGFIAGAISYSSRKVETYFFRKFRDFKHFRQTTTFIPKVLAKYLPKEEFYNKVSRVFGWKSLKRNRKPLSDYVNRFLMRGPQAYRDSTKNTSANLDV